MAAVAFDALRFVRTLRDKAKMSPEQAEGLAEAIQVDLATKSDIIQWTIGFQSVVIVGAIVALSRITH